MLSVDNLEVGYGNITALRGVTIKIARGETIAVVGPNGAGKSSLLLAIAGVVRPRAGSIQVDGKDLVGPPEARVANGISLVPEGRHIFSSLTVAENLALGCTTRTDQAAAAKDVTQILELFPVLSNRYRQRAGKLSGGEQQMLAIGRAMLSRPQLLLLDEPSLGLAPLIVDQVYAAIASLRSQGVTVLLVEQSARRALSASDRTYVLNGGLVTLHGPSMDLASSDTFDAAYFGRTAA